MCSATTSIDGNSNPNGIVISRGYPRVEAGVDCSIRFTTNDPNKVFRFYVTDINIDMQNGDGK
jgi:hypothetical protein